jgi:hypothetical protein
MGVNILTTILMAGGSKKLNFFWFNNNLYTWCKKQKITSLAGDVKIIITDQHIFAIVIS